MTARDCHGCGWSVPTFVPEPLVLAALTDHRANACAPQPEHAAAPEAPVAEQVP